MTFENDQTNEPDAHVDFGVRTLLLGALAVLLLASVGALVGIYTGVLTGGWFMVPGLLMAGLLGYGYASETL